MPPHPEDDSSARGCSSAEPCTHLFQLFGLPLELFFQRRHGAAMLLQRAVTLRTLL